MQGQIHQKQKKKTRENLMSGLLKINPYALKSIKGGLSLNVFQLLLSPKVLRIQQLKSQQKSFSLEENAFLGIEIDWRGISTQG